MSLFACEECQCIENTATCMYWSRGDGKKLCSECDPRMGKWHGIFKKRSAVGMLIDQSGHLWSQEQADAGVIPDHFKIVGRVDVFVDKE